MRKSTSMIAGFTAAMIFATTATAATSTVRVDENGDGGWQFNRDVNTSSPFEFTTTQSTIGSGSLHVLPIANVTADGMNVDAKDKFIAELFTMNLLTSAFDSFSVDVLLQSSSTPNHVYVNVYTIRPESGSTYYDCRFDYVFDGTLGTWQTLTADNTAAATAVDDRFDGEPRTDDGYDCPSSIAALPENSTIPFLSVNLGDTTLSDGGAEAYFDKAVLTTTTDTTTYDFEVPLAPLTDKSQCMDGSYVNYGFNNQGQCVASLQANENAGK